jgi:uncharacterized membrane protein
MINNLLSALTLVSALGCGLIAGVFFAFSVFVMKALATLDPASGSAISVWSEYVTNWTAWNHVRAIAALAAVAFFIVGLCWSRDRVA